MVEVLNAVADDPDKLFETVMVAYNFESEPEIKAAIARAAQAGIGVIAMKTQAGGYKATDLGGVSPHQAALKWVLQDENVACAIPSMVNVNMLEENVAVMGMPLTESDVAILDQYGDAIASRYCRRCRSCEGTCPRGVDIPNINRCLMYAEGYGDPHAAKSTYRREVAASSSAVACESCAECTARCAYGLNIQERMSKARSLLA
jgi:predicted aldo/keto reductase-like oxidoreductase